MAKAFQATQPGLENIPDAGSVGPVVDQADSGEPSPLECAVLMDCIYGKHDDIITLPVKEAQAAEQSGCIDTHPNAVAAIRAGV